MSVQFAIPTLEMPAPDGHGEAHSTATFKALSETFLRVTLKFGFKEQPNVPKTLAIARKLGWQFEIMSTSFFLSRRAGKIWDISSSQSNRTWRTEEARFLNGFSGQSRTPKGR
jgi:K+ transporter